MQTRRTLTGLVAVVVAAVLVVPAALGADAFAPDEKTDKSDKSDKTDKTSRKRTSDSKKRKIDKNAPWVVPRAGYRRLLEKVFEREESPRELRLRLRVVPDGYVYYMARDLEEIERAGYEGKKLESEVKKLHRKHRIWRGKVLLLLDFVTSGDRAYCFLRQSPQKHVEVKLKKKRLSMSITEVKPKPKWGIWQVFETPPNSKRRVNRLKLANVTRMNLGLASASLRTKNEEPFTVTVSGIIVSKFTGGIESINERERQISANRIRDVTIDNVRFTVYPKRWKVPKMSSALADLIERLN